MRVACPRRRLVLLSLVLCLTLAGCATKVPADLDSATQERVVKEHVRMSWAGIAFGAVLVVGGLFLLVRSPDSTLMTIEVGRNGIAVHDGPVGIALVLLGLVLIWLSIRNFGVVRPEEPKDDDPRR